MTDFHVLHDHVGREELTKVDYFVPCSTVKRITHGLLIRIPGVTNAAEAGNVVARLMAIIRRLLHLQQSRRCIEPYKLFYVSSSHLLGNDRLVSIIFSFFLALILSTIINRYSKSYSVKLISVVVTSFNSGNLFPSIPILLFL